MSGDPITRNTAKAVPIHVVDGFTVGRDGKRLSPFAVFVDRVRYAQLDTGDQAPSFAVVDDGSIAVFGMRLAVVNADG